MTAKESLPGDSDILQVALIMFAVMSLGTTEFIKDSFPMFAALRPPKTIVVYLIIIVQLMPAAILVGADRYIASREGAERWLRNFRRGVFVLALALILRQIQLYWGPATDFTNDVRSASVVLLVLLDLVVVTGLVLLAWQGYRGLVTFFYYMSPIAIAASAIIVFQVQTDELDVPLYAQEVATVSEADEKPPVFVIVFDGLGYDTMYPDGELDRESFPNAARLADSGVSFSDATSNFFWSFESLPTIVEPASELTDDYNVRLYTQYPVLEAIYFPECGTTITCRGARYLTETAPLRVASYLALRTVYQVTPKVAETVISMPMGWALDGLGWPFPSADRPGWQTFTKRQFDEFMGDVDAEQARGRLYIVHLMVPHDPYAFDEDGNALSTVGSYRSQAMFADKLLGRFIDKLETEGLFDESVVIVTSDHGTRPVTPSETAVPLVTTPRVPLIIHAPSVDDHGVVMDVEYQHIDFGPTLADVLGLSQPTDSDGVSAFSDERLDRDKTFAIDGIEFVYNEEDSVWEHAEKALPD
ncbi:MAG TPA: sulfatase-like hydrolase/transferase [Dehalococcoidia bacterium]